MKIMYLKIFALLMLFSSTSELIAQKKIVGDSALTNWKKLGSSGMSPDGKFMHYTYTYSTGGYLVLLTNDKPMDTISDAGSKFLYAADNRYLFFGKQGDSLVKFDLLRRAMSVKPHILDWKLISGDDGETLVYKTRDGVLHLESLASSKSLVFKDVNNYWAGLKGNCMVVLNTEGLHWISLKDYRRTKMTSNTSILGLTLALTEDRAFYYNNEDGSKVAQVFEKDGDKLIALFSEDTSEIPKGYKIDGTAPYFTPDGKKLVFKFPKIEPTLSNEEKSTGPNMKIWHYAAPTVEQAIAVVNLSQGTKLQVIKTGHVELCRRFSENSSQVETEFLALTVIPPTNWQSLYSKAATFEGLIYNFRSDSLKSCGVIANFFSPAIPYISPAGKFLYWYDVRYEEFVCYDMASGKLAVVSDKIPVPRDMKWQAQGSVPHRVERQMISWLKNDEAVILEDRYDLWQVDPRDAKIPINLTSGFGRKNEIKFRLWPQQEISSGSTLYCRAINQIDKREGMAIIKVGNGKGFKIGSMLVGHFNPHRLSKLPSSKNILFEIETATESPNLYTTSDLVVYKKLSDIHPERQYNWLTSELIRYPLGGDKNGTAIVYKPENFDPSKKYPVMFNYYQKRSDELHYFLDPNSSIDINIPQYVSSGYVVVVPDIINDVPGKISQTTVNSVKSAVNYLKKYPWFDHTRMGIQGQSFGGYETNILIANTDLFAAAQASDGPSNMAVFGQSFEGNRLNFNETGQPNLNTTIYEHPEIYLENSPFIKADKITTPLLLLHGRKDNIVHFNQSENMFYALKRLGKPVWLVEYGGGNHAYIGDDNANMDFNVRRKQFFDHYLKGTPMPMWMKESGNLSLELDTAGKNKTIN